MQLLTDYNRPFILDNLTTPMVIKYNWVFTGVDTDFKLSPISYLEETTGAALKLQINGARFWVPATWHILIADSDTCQVDTINVAACANTNYTAYSFCPDETKMRVLDISVVGYVNNIALVHPMISKGSMLVHPVGPFTTYNRQSELQLSVVIGPHDLHKHLNGKTVGDIMSW